jgi:tetratricopeptide (TPR) repeat protein
MTVLQRQTITIPTTAVGPENPLPAFRAKSESTNVDVASSIPEQDRKYLGCKTGYRVLPYRLQDNYHQELLPTEFETFVLENEILRAVFLPAMGGRLLSLYHKPQERELLVRNPIMRMGNLGLRCAWFSGGIEWNTAQPGHHYLTCAPMFAARINGLQGEPALRIYEWERTKCFPWQIDFYLPPASPVLLARVRMINPHDHQLPVYWWTNIAVPEEEDVRVLAPTSQGIKSGLGLKMKIVELDAPEAVDICYSTRIKGSRDLFFRIPDKKRPWVTALDGAGSGFFQVSTARQRGRKMFIWGSHPGGLHCQEFLGADTRYVEIQAGLTRTQQETVPMPARTEWGWTEAFGLLEADSEKIHGNDWSAAIENADQAIESQISNKQLEKIDKQLAARSSAPAEEILSNGSGWGALERLRASSSGQRDLIPPELIFPADTIGPDQAPWLKLLLSGAMPEQESQSSPGQFMIQPEWQELLEKSLDGDGAGNWLAWLHLGVARNEAFDSQGAAAAWEKSIECCPSSWALRNLAVQAGRGGKTAEAIKLYEQACRANPETTMLALEYIRALAAAGNHETLRKFISELSSELRNNEWMVLEDIQALVALGLWDQAQSALDREFHYIREGDTLLSNLWFDLHRGRIAQQENIENDQDLKARVCQQFPVPHHLDYRQNYPG